VTDAVGTTSANLDDSFDPQQFGFDGDDWDEEEGFTVNFSDQEASSELRDYKPIPRGHYLVHIFECKVEESKSKKNKGRPMYNFTLVVDKEKHPDAAGKRVWDRACLWEGALYTISQIMQALGLDPKSGRIPPARWFVGKTLIAAVTVEQAKDKNPDTDAYDIPKFEDVERKVPVYQNNVKGYLSVDSPKAQLVGSKGSKPAATSSAGVTNLEP
jgi:hypothetical protein